MVRGGGAKPWRQKGTGRARAGTSRSPLWTGGGAVFGPHPRHYIVKVNRKARKAALRSALSVHAERGTVSVLDPAASTRRRPRRPTACSKDRLGGSVLVVVAPDQDVPAKSFRNLERVNVVCRPRTCVSPTSSARRSSSSPRTRSTRSPSARRAR